MALTFGSFETGDFSFKNNEVVYVGPSELSNIDVAPSNVDVGPRNLFNIGPENIKFGSVIWTPGSDAAIAFEELVKKRLVEYYKEELVIKNTTDPNSYCEDSDGDDSVDSVAVDYKPTLSDFFPEERKEEFGCTPKTIDPETFKCLVEKFNNLWPLHKKLFTAIAEKGYSFQAKSWGLDSRQPYGGKWVIAIPVRVLMQDIASGLREEFSTMYNNPFNAYIFSGDNKIHLDGQEIVPRVSQRLFDTMWEIVNAPFA